MGMWPFRRKSNRRKLVVEADIIQAESHDERSSRDPARDGSELASAGPERRKSRRDTKRKSSRDSKKLQKDPERRRAYSFSPGRNDSIRVPRDENPPPIPPLPSNWKGKGRSNTQGPESNVVQRPLRSSTQPTDAIQEWQRMPTLHKRTGQELGRRKSSKKRKEDHDREAEIKAMVAFLPSQSQDVKATGKLKKRQSTKRKGPFSRSPDNPSSDISLPLAESLKSTRSESSGNETSFKLSSLDVLAPRPTIRYSERPKYAPGASGFMSERSESRMKRISERVPVSEGAMKASKRIDDLADDLSAGELRELMERDAKRKEKKRIAERIKSEQRIAREQEKQRQNEAAAIRDGTPSPPNMERGVMGREVVGLGIGTSAIVTSSKRKGSLGSNSGRGKRPAEIFRQETPSGSPVDAFNPFSFHRSASLTTENMTPVSDRSDPVLEVAQLGTIAKAKVSPTLQPRGHNRGTSSISQMIELSREDAPTSLPMAQSIPTQHFDPPRRSSETSTRAPQSWTSFFKLRQRNKPAHTPTSSSFSNTSRDSMHTAAGPQFGYQPMRSTSNIPKRTMSKFREDLPELPMSPPASRVQSPESDQVPPIRNDFSEKRAANIFSEDPRVRYDTPNSGYRSMDAMRLRDETPTSGYRSIIPSPEPIGVLSQSLASIDSEGSWLSGRRTSKRGPVQVQHPNFHDSSDSLSKKYKELSESAEELGIAEDEYFSRLTPGPEEEFKIDQTTPGNPMPSSDEEADGSMPSPVASEKSQWRGAVARHPTVIHRATRAKSREVLLNDFEDDGMSDITAETPDGRRESYDLDSNSPTSLGPQRATSVNLSRHHRNISSGSARLLDVKPRASGDAKRASTSSRQD